MRQPTAKQIADRADRAREEVASLSSDPNRKFTAKWSATHETESLLAHVHNAREPYADAFKALKEQKVLDAAVIVIAALNKLTAIEIDAIRTMIGIAHHTEPRDVGYRAFQIQDSFRKAITGDAK
jgi:hypothetical protein